MVGPGGAPPPAIEEVSVFAFVLADEPVLIVIPHVIGSMISEDGALLAADAFESAVRAHGARPLLDLDFLGAPVPGWMTLFDPETTAVRITGPGLVGNLFDGTLPTSAAWRQRVAENSHRGLVVITGSTAPTPDDALEMIDAGRASWIRTTLSSAGTPTE